MAQEALEGLRFAPVDRGNWRDLAELFESRGGPKYCWCMAWRRKPPDAKCGSAAERQAALKGALESQVEKGVAVGLLACDGSVPVAWCSVAPRESFRRLGGQEPEGEGPADVWSIVCFFVRRDFRRSGVVARLIEAAKGYAGLRRREGSRGLPGQAGFAELPVHGNHSGVRGRRVPRVRAGRDPAACDAVPDAAFAGRAKLAPGSSRAPLPPEDVIA